jgi:hypothetical protein
MAFLLGGADFALVIHANHLRAGNCSAFPAGLPGAKPDFWRGLKHGNRGNAFVGVQVAGLLGHVSRSAVFLIHLEGLGPTPREGKKEVFASVFY